MRKAGLDILRGLAVILVLFRHSGLNNSNIVKYFGWLGVDLFFVLSGYLISNILFIEYKKNHSIRVKRFLIRRGFKIFPSFYFYMFATVIFYLITGSSEFRWQQFVSELFYVQSYSPGIWVHTWSLAVEEQFYLIFSITILLLSRKKILKKRGAVIGSLIFLLVLSFSMRFIATYPHRLDDHYFFMKTHLRADGILFGILLSYLLNFTRFFSGLQKRKLILSSLGILLILPGFYYGGGSFFMNTAGLTLVNLGFALLVLLSLNMDDYLSNHSSVLLKSSVKAIGFIGINSYSIYLWHLNAKDIVYAVFSYNTVFMTFLYLLLALALGIIMYNVIEKPLLQLRDYFFGKVPLFSTLRSD